MIKKIIILAVSVFLMTACGEEAVKPEKQDIQKEETNQEKTAELKEEINQATADLNKEEEAKKKEEEAAALALKQKEEEANALALKQAEEQKQKEEEANALALKQAEEQKQKEEAEAAALALKKRDEEAMKALAKQQIKKEKILFKAVFYPYFRNRGEVPYQLKVDLEKKIPEIISILKKNPKASLFVKGYTTTDGPNRFNQFLSLWRARETAEYLSWKSGISLKKIKVKGLGANSGKEKRKVEIVISKKS